MSTINAVQRFITQAVETFTAAEMPATASGNRSVALNQFDVAKTLNASSTPPATKAWAGSLTGNQTLDFSALTRSFGATVNATGLRLQMLLCNNLSATDAVVIAKGASNGYAFNGAAGDQTIPPGGSVQVFLNDGLVDIDGTHKTLDITAVGEFQIILVFG